MQNHKIIKTLMYFFILALAVASIFLLQIHHVRTHLKLISNASNNVLTTHKLVPSSVNLHARTIIFYRDSCPHCQHVIPYVYLVNKLSHDNIQYRDLNIPKNELMADRLNTQNNFPDARRVSIRDGQLLSQHEPLIQTNHLLLTVNIIAALLILLCIAYVLALIF